MIRKKNEYVEIQFKIDKLKNEFENLNDKRVRIVDKINNVIQNKKIIIKNNELNIKIKEVENILLDLKDQFNKIQRDEIRLFQQDCRQY